LAPAAALALWLWHRHGWRRALTLAAVTTAATLAGYLGAGTASLAALHEGAQIVSPYSIWALPRTLAIIHAVARGRTIFTLGRVNPALIAAALPFALALTTFVVLTQFRRSTPVMAVSGAAVAYALTAVYVTPWYIAWAIPVLALEWR